MTTAGLLLTGGQSRRLGQDKASLSLIDGGPTLAQSIGQILASVCRPCLELGPGRSQLPHLADRLPGAGPLAAVAGGWSHLRDQGFRGPALVVATDLPGFSSALAQLLSSHPSPRSVVPLFEGRPQPLCARFCPEDLDLAVSLYEDGQRSMSALLGRMSYLVLPAEGWTELTGDPLALADLDTPEDLARLRGAHPPSHRSCR